MREININIEGYNVNGICVGCLNYNRKMFYRDEVKHCFKVLGDIDVPDGLTMQVCWECLAAVKAAHRFQAQILQSYEILINYSQQNIFLNSPEDLSQHAHKRLSACHINTESYTVPFKEEEPEVEVKAEAADEEENAVKVPDPGLGDQKLEVDIDLNKGFYDYFGTHTQDTSDDDVQLSKLKRKKEKKEKKIKKNKKNGKNCSSGVKRKGRTRETKEEPAGAVEDPSRGGRKLKNLPADLVELFTLSEDQMWQVRSEDVESDDFTRLKYKCSDCILSFNTEKLMNDHMSGKHRQKAEDCQQCDVCKSYFLTKDNLSVHRSLHLQAFKCKECGFFTGLKRVMAAHVKTHRGEDESYECSACDKVFSTKSKLSYHKNVCHQDKPQCDCCGKVFANKMTLKYHLNNLTPQTTYEKPKEKLYIPCKGCNKVFHSKKSYRAHVVIHNGITYPCPVCGKLFQWKRNLARHQRNHRERAAGARHECRDCGKTFASRDCYANHMRLSRRHVPEHAYPHECNYCGKKFATKWCMVDHIDWDHLKRIKYQCSVCFKPFKTAKIMVAHVNNIHEGKRSREPDGEHLCEICGKSYKTVKRLKGHVWAMHTNRSHTKSFRCALCPATFTWQTSVYKHVKVMHDNSKRTKSRPAAAVAAALTTQVKKQEPPAPAPPELDARMYFPQHVALAGASAALEHAHAHAHAHALHQNIIGL